MMDLGLVVWIALLVAILNIAGWLLVPPAHNGEVPRWMDPMNAVPDSPKTAAEAVDAGVDGDVDSDGGCDDKKSR